MKQKKRNQEQKLEKAKQKFGELFYKGGSLKLKKDVTEGSWKQKALSYAKVLMGSWAPKHEHKELVCAMIFEECLDLEPSIIDKIKSKL